MADLRASKSDAEVGKLRKELEAHAAFRKGVEARIRQDALRSAIPAGLPDSLTKLVLRGLASEVGDFEVDVEKWAPKEPSKIAEALKGIDLSALGANVATEKHDAKPNAPILPPPIQPGTAQRRPGGVLKPSRLDARPASSMADSIAAKVAAQISSEKKGK